MTKSLEELKNRIWLLASNDTVEGNAFRSEYDALADEIYRAGQEEGRNEVIEIISYKLDCAEQDKEMADDPDDPKVRITYFRHILEAARTNKQDV